MTTYPYKQCPDCGSLLLINRHNGLGVFERIELICAKKCGFIGSINVDHEHCPECGNVLVEKPNSLVCRTCGVSFDKGVYENGK